MLYIFDHLQGVRESLGGRYLFLFLDYDGTLAPIAGTPKKAVIPRGTKETLRLILKTNNLKLAVISGRPLAGIKKMVGLKGVIYSGNHGFQVEGPKIKYELKVPKGYKNLLRGIKARLKRKLSGISGVLIEDKKFFLTLHFRLVEKDKRDFIKTAFREVIARDLERNNIQARVGKMVFELGPPLRWNKGKIVSWLFSRRQSICGTKNVLPVYIGDDSTDEDAFRALKNKGLTVFVGKPRSSKADYYLKNTKDVDKFLRLLLELKPS